MGEKRLLSAISEFGDSRYLVIKGEPWFMAKDVCDQLGLTNSRQATAGLDDDEKMDGVTISDTVGRKNFATFVNESGLYSLIFQSRKPQAKAFRKWVTSEVLPSIRRMGYYINPRATLSRKDRNALRRTFYKELNRNITGEDIYKCARRFRCPESRIESVLRGGIEDNDLMQDLQARAIETRAKRIDAYSDSRLSEVLDILK